MTRTQPPPPQPQPKLQAAERRHSPHINIIPPYATLRIHSAQSSLLKSSTRPPQRCWIKLHARSLYPVKAYKNYRKNTFASIYFDRIKNAKVALNCCLALNTAL
jgi:hypothetical protein